MKAFTAFRETGNIERAAAQLGFKKGKTNFRLPPGVTVQGEYLPRISLNLFFPGQCINPDGIVRDAEAAGFGRGYVGLADEGKGVPRRISFSRVSTENKSLDIDILIAQGRHCVDAVVLQ